VHLSALHEASLLTVFGKLYKVAPDFLSMTRILEMQPIAIDDPVACRCVSLLVCVYVSLSVTSSRLAKMTERIEVLFGVETLVGPRHIVLDWVPIPLR